MALVEKFKKGDIVVVKGIRSPRMQVYRVAGSAIHCVWFSTSDKVVIESFDVDLLELYEAPVNHPMLD